MTVHDETLFGLDNFTPDNGTTFLAELGESGSNARVEIGDTYVFDTSGGTSYDIQVNEAAGGSNDLTMSENQTDQTLVSGVTITSPWVDRNTVAIDNTDVTFNGGEVIHAVYRITFSGDDGETYTFFGVSIDNTQGGSNPLYGGMWQGAVPPDGTTLTVTANVNNSNYFYVCFAAGTQIETRFGPQNVEDIEIGDAVLTQDQSYKKVRWVGARSFGKLDLNFCKSLTPVRISKGALGHGLPKRDLLVSRQHRILVSSKIAERITGHQDVLVPACKLTALPGISFDADITEIKYVHILLEQHDVIFAEGAPCESLFTGKEALAALDKQALEEIHKIFPDLFDNNNCALPKLGIPTAAQQNSLMRRHAKNAQPALQTFRI